jgi:GT2 family glycosyltransferase/glycosyltransferase involved in cell wall biosynthesis
VNYRQQISRNNASLKDALRGILPFVEAGNYEDAMQRLYAAGNYAWLHSCGQLACVEIENLIIQLSEVLPAIQVPQQQVTQPFVATVLTSIHAAGGHSRLAWRWIQLDQDRQHHVILTNQGSAPIPVQMQELVETGRVTLTRLDAEPSLWGRAMQLRQLVVDAEAVVLHIHPDDPIAPVALARMSTAVPVLFVDHASHVFWMGACAANLVITLHEKACRTTATRRGVPATQICWWPFSFDSSRLDGLPRLPVREQLDIPANAVTLLTSGWPYKFHAIEGLSFSKALAPVLASRPNTHLIAVGPAAGDSAWKDLLANFPGRIHLLGVQDEQFMNSCYHACDIYLDSIPFSSGSAVMEAAALGKPIIKFATQEMRDSGFAVDIDTVPLSAYNWTDLDAYRNSLLDLIDMTPDERAMLGSIYSSSIRNWHNDDVCRFFLEKAYRQAKNSAKIQIAADLVEEKFEPLDRLLMALGCNYRLCQGEKPEQKTRLLAFYLPQFHEIPENNAWWGQGFTEWANVRQGKPLFKGHGQPLVPTELGYYDLSSTDVLSQQAKLAKEHGVHGFCFYYYWFDGKRLLEKPVDQLIQATDIDLPFCLCWANENWTKRWDGGNQEVLMHQSYSPSLHESFASDLIAYFSDLRYIKIDEKPVLLVYRTDIIPDLINTIAAWRSAWRNLGVGEVYLIAVESFQSINPLIHGFDACSEFPPHQVNFLGVAPDQALNLIADPKAIVGDYNKLSESWLNRPTPDYKRFRSLLPSWDNSARRRKGGATLFVNANPVSYECWLTQTIARTLREFEGEERLVFINAWNEWGEGCTLEPDARWGRAYLEATQRVMKRSENDLLLELDSSEAHESFAYCRWLQADQIKTVHPLFSQFEKSDNALSICVAVTARGCSEELNKTLDAVKSQLRAADDVIVIVDNFLATEKMGIAPARWTLLLCEGDLLEDDALLLLEQAIARKGCEKTLVVYFDHDEIGPEVQPAEPHFKPDFNHDLLLSYPYMGRALAVRTSWARTHLIQADGIFNLPLAYHLALQAFSEAGEAGFVHVPAVLAHLSPNEPNVFATDSVMWQKLAQIASHHLQVEAPGTQVLEGPAPGTFHVLYPLHRTPLVSVVIPTRDQLPFLSRCIESLLEKTNYPNFEVLVVDNDSQTKEANEFLAGLAQLAPDRIRVLQALGTFNFSRMNNLAVNEARGEFILMLNNDTAALQPDWLTHMVRNALREDVGVVGARLLYPDGSIQHAGVIMGMRGPAEHPSLGMQAIDRGYLFRAQLQRNFSAVTAACLMVSKSLYQALGGLNEAAFGVSYNDVDFCLRVGQTGRRIVWTPLATLMHEGSASQKRSIEAIGHDQKVARFTKEQASMYERWPTQIANDSAYNPNLSLTAHGYEIETNPLLRFDKLQGLTNHRVIAFAADEHGCGHYRIHQPMQAMLQAGLCTGGISPTLMGPNLVLRSGADTLIFQRPTTDEWLNVLTSLQSLKHVKKIYEVDDNLSRVPLKSAYHEHMDKNLQKRILKSINLCDRLVVSTEALAHALEGQSDDIRVIQNRLPTAMWGTSPPRRLEPTQRQRAGKPRVGWAGGIGHQGDLEMIFDVIKDLADQVDWIFFGMCPESIRPYVREFYAGVPTLQYPKMLMAQDWDLAIAPLELNSFNECKSNLKLLEYGWCGVPVVCSDITPYQSDLPATRVKNRFKDWRDAIRERISDLDACREEGAELQLKVAQDWTLKGNHLQTWFKAWAD